jgi:hypothetical protein
MRGADADDGRGDVAAVAEAYSRAGGTPDDVKIGDDVPSIVPSEA